MKRKTGRMYRIPAITGLPPWRIWPPLNETKFPAPKNSRSILNK